MRVCAHHDLAAPLNSTACMDTKSTCSCWGVRKSSRGVPSSNTRTSNQVAFLLRRSMSRMTRMSAVFAAVLNTSCHSVALSMPAGDT